MTARIVCAETTLEGWTGHVLAMINTRSLLICANGRHLNPQSTRVRTKYYWELENLTFEVIQSHKKTFLFFSYMVSKKIKIKLKQDKHIIIFTRNSRKRRICSLNY